MLADYDYWHQKMLDWLKAGTEERKSGSIFFRSFLQELGTILETPTRIEHKTAINVSIQYDIMACPTSYKLLKIYIQCVRNV